MPASKEFKSCFNFRQADKTLFFALDRLTRKSRERFRAEGLLPASSARRTR